MERGIFQPLSAQKERKMIVMWDIYGRKYETCSFNGREFIGYENMGKIGKAETAFEAFQTAIDFMAEGKVNSVWFYRNGDLSSWDFESMSKVVEAEIGF